MDDSSKSHVKIINFADFDKVFNPLIEGKKTFYAYFYGDYDADGKSWCGDCNTAKPNVIEAEKFLEGQSDVIFYRFPIEQTSWKDKSFYYRIHPKLKLTNVPTLIFFKKGAEFARLVEGQLNDSENVNDLIKLSK
jgi:thiol-disulfide isomerase/thioredoxin